MVVIGRTTFIVVRGFVEMVQNDTIYLPKQLICLEKLGQVSYIRELQVFQLLLKTFDFCQIAVKNIK